MTGPTHRLPAFRDQTESMEKQAMAHVRKGYLATSPEWWKHLRKTNRQFWKRHRKAERYEVDLSAW